CRKDRQAKAIAPDRPRLRARTAAPRCPILWQALHGLCAARKRTALPFRAQKTDGVQRLKNRAAAPRGGGRMLDHRPYSRKRMSAQSQLPPAVLAAALEAVMILRREQLGTPPTVFRAMTGLTVAAFDQPLPELLAAFAAARRRRLDRPNRRRAVGGG